MMFTAARWWACHSRRRTPVSRPMTRQAWGFLPDPPRMVAGRDASNLCACRSGTSLFDEACDS
jgi:hypothetical protein